uniref:Adhesion G protein-coupled receptor B1 n=1 Tax=Cyclopterus lumpus TaxID=8103 RepID=A0A8C2ZNE0_CYCLU
MAWSPLTGPCVALLLLFFGLTSCTPSGPASATCATLEQSRFFGVFSSMTTLHSTPCSWTLQNPDPRRYTVYMKITKPTDSCVPRQIKTFQFDSFIETSRTYLGMESFDEVVRLCDASTTVTYLESTKQFLQIRKVATRNSVEMLEGQNDVSEFKAEFLVVGKRNPSMPACQMLCQWLEKCLSSSTHDYPCGIMNTPCQCWEAPKRKPGSCYRGGVYVEKCLPVSRDNILDSKTDEWSPWSACSITCGEGWQSRTRVCATSSFTTQCTGPLRENRPCNNTAVCPVDGAWDEWTPWSLCSSTCGRGYRDRTRTCPSSAHARCNSMCLCLCILCLPPVDGSWNEWSVWSACTTSCSNGTMQRIRECNGTYPSTYPCYFIEPHEICPEQNTGDVVWKKTPAGDMAAIACPADASGLILRRCTLDAVGLASWESPTHIKCINLSTFLLQSRDYNSKAQMGQSVDGVSEVISRLRVSSDEGAKYSGDLLAVMEILKNTTEQYKATRLRLSNADVEVSQDEEHRDKWEEAQLVPVTSECCSLTKPSISQSLSFSVLSIHKRPTSTNSNFTFPVKGWRGMLDWVRTSEEKISVSLDIICITLTLYHKYLSMAHSDVSTLGSLTCNSIGHVLNIYVFHHMRKKCAIHMRGLSELSSHNPSFLSPSLCSSSLLGSWSARSCRAVPVHSFRTKCVCDSLSTFAILARVNFDSSLLPSVTLIVGCGSAMLASNVIYCALWYIRSERSVILINFCLSIICSNALILIGQTQVVCTLVAALLHFFFLSSFCWVLTEAWQSYMAVTGRLRNRIIRKRFLCLGWGLPALVVAVSVGFTKAKGYGTVNYCWLSLEGGLLYSFVGPAAAVVLVNMVIGILVFNKLVSKDGITDVKLKERAGASLWSSCVVLPLLALTWMSAVLAITDRRSALFQILFAVFDSLEGFIIVMVHCILRRESSSEEKMPPPQLPLPMGSNFHTLPSNPSKSHMQAVPEYSSHTLTLKREKSRLAGGINPSCGKPVYVCEGELFQQLDADLARAQAEGSISDGSSYVLMPNTTSTLRSKPKDDPTKYNISVEQLPQARLMHLSGPFAEPQAAFGIKSMPHDQVSVSYSERDSPIQNIHNMSSESHITHSSLENTFESMNSMMSKSETISTLSMSSLERQKSRYAELDFEKIMHTKKRHQNMFQDLNRKLHHAEKDRESPASDSKVTYHHYMMLIIHVHRHSFSGDADQNMRDITEAILKLNTISLNVILTL